MLLALAATDAAGYSVIAPVLPSVARVTGASTTTIGLLAACFPLAMLLGFVVGGRLVRAGRGTTALLGALAVVAAGAAAFSATTSLPLLFLARTVMGVGSGGLWIGVTLRTLEYWPGEEYRCMSRIYAAYSVGALVGPALGALGGVHRPFLAYLALVVAAMPLVVALPRPAAHHPFRSDRSALRLPGFWYAASAILFAILAPGILDGILPLHFATRLTQTQIGVLYTGTALLIAVASAVTGSVSPRRALAAGGIALTAGIGAAGAATSVPVWLGALAATGLGAGAAQTAATGLLLEAVPTQRIVTAMVVWSQIGMTGYLLGPALGAPLTHAFGFGALGVLPLGAGLVVVGTGWCSRARRR
jgi:MFS family permease